MYEHTLRLYLGVDVPSQTYSRDPFHVTDMFVALNYLHDFSPQSQRFSWISFLSS